MQSPRKRAALIVASAAYAYQCYVGYKLYKSYGMVVDASEGLLDFSNRSAYLVTYLIVKCLENGIELTEFDQQVLANPPKLDDPENPNLFGEFFERCQELGMTPDSIETFFQSLQLVRDSDH